MQNNSIIVWALFVSLTFSGCAMMNGYSSYTRGDLDNTSSTESSGNDSNSSDGGVTIEQGNSDYIWVSTEGDDANEGTIDAPFRTISKAIEEVILISGTKDVHIVGGSYAEAVKIGDQNYYYGIRLYGGYGALDTSSGTRIRDVSAYPTVLDSVVIDGSFGVSANNINTVIDGLKISKLEIKDAAPTINENTISSNIESKTCKEGAVVSVETTSNNDRAPIISNNHIENIGCSYGGLNLKHVAVEISAKDQSILKPQFDSNVIVSDSSNANIADAILSFVAHASELAIVEPIINNNTISSGEAIFFSEAVNIYSTNMDAVAKLKATGNEIRSSAGELTFGIDLGYNGLDDDYAFFNSADIERNKIFGGEQNFSSTGISIYSALEVSTIRNNFISGGNSSVEGALLSGITLDGANADIINNTITANSSDSAWLIQLVFATDITTIKNNILSAIGDGYNFIGIVEAFDSPPLSIESNLFDTSLSLIYSSLINGDFLIIDDLVSFYPDFTDNILGSALLVDPANMDMHISAQSAAIDAGSSLDAPDVDFDGDPRPQGAGVDIGADELI